MKELVCLKEKNEEIKKNGQIASIAIGVYVLLTCILYVLTSRGVVDWIYGFNLELNPYIEFGLSTIGFSLKLLLVTSIVSGKSVPHNVKINFIFLLINIILRLAVGNGFVLNTVFPIVAMGVVAHINKQWSWWLKTLVIILLYQLLSGFVFIGIDIYGGYTDTNIGNEMLFSLNLNLFLLLIYYARRLKHDILLYSIPRADDEVNGDIRQEIDEIAKLTKPQRVIMLSLLIASQLFQWFLLLFVSWTFNLFTFTLISSTTFLLIGMVARFKVHWELSSTLKTYIACTLTTSMMFLVMARLLPSIHYSLILSVYSAIALTIILNRLGHLQAFIKKNKKSFKLIEVTESEIIEIWHKLSSTKTHLPFVVDAFVNKLSNRQLREKYFYTASTVKEYKRRYKERLIQHIE